METPSTSEMIGRFTMGNATALITEQPSSLTFQMIAELCNSNGLHFNGFSLLIINELQKEQVHNINCNVKMCLLCNTTDKHFSPQLRAEKYKISQYNNWKNELHSWCSVPSHCC